MKPLTVIVARHLAQEIENQLGLHSLLLIIVWMDYGAAFRFFLSVGQTAAKGHCPQWGERLVHT